MSDSRFEEILEIDSEDLDEVLRGVAHEYRRIALTLLKVEGAPLSIPELADAIVDDMPIATDPTPVAASLYHVHLPKLAQGNLVEFDAETGLSTYTSHPTLEEVFGIIYESEAYLVDRFDGFLDGLQDSFTRVGSWELQRNGWPHHWREYQNG